MSTRSLARRIGMRLTVDDVVLHRCDGGGMPLPRRRLSSTALSLTALLALASLVALSGCAASTASGTPAPGAATQQGPLDDADGYIPDGSSLSLDSDKPAVRHLTPALLDALREAQSVAAERGTEITIADGWRSERYQEHLFAVAVAQYGSEEEASRWVKRGQDSAHVTGDAVDIATADAMDFLNRFGAEWGLCQVYANEMWHFELRTEPGGECPLPAADGRG
ncbi:M15 family metallopeptidase [Leifsonia sp. NPDC058194]|uniref:M15 family metallopeptidase n=1 Tax=Leifsonia sp. NPDC058194 TaxID=3346374 RepID=UPI0036DCB7F6